MFLALREIIRNRTRFALLGGAVGLLVVLLLFFQSVAAALTTSLTGALANQTAEVVVYDDRARQNPAASVLSPDTDRLVSDVDGVAEAAPVTQVPVVLVGPDGAQVDGAVVGIDPGAPGTPSELAASLPGAGEAIASGSGFDAGFPVGSRVRAGTSEVPLKVVGQADDASANASPTLYVTRPTLAEVLGTGPRPPVSWVGVEPQPGVDPGTLAERITAGIDGVEALDREAAVAGLPGVGTISRSFGILYALLFVVVTIVTGVFFLILTVQKRDSLVLLRAIGARRRDVTVPVLVQVVVVVGIGMLLGTATTAGLLAAARDTFGTGLAPTTALTSGAAVLGLALVAAGAAVRRVLAIDPAEAMSAGGLE